MESPRKPLNKRQLIAIHNALSKDNSNQAQALLELLLKRGFFQMGQRYFLGDASGPIAEIGLIRSRVGGRLEFRLLAVLGETSQYHGPKPKGANETV